MSLLTELEARGVTAEDLEKAASVRFFEKAAAAEGVNLDELGESQVEELYASFIHNHSSVEDDHSKEASAMNDEIVDLFEKTAAAEGIDLDVMEDAELAELYNHYVENVLPEQIGEYEKEASHEDEAYEDEAYEKLAEAEILGRHMARAYMDEMDKEAGEKKKKYRTGLGPRVRAMNRGQDPASGGRRQIGSSMTSNLGGKLKELVTGHQAAASRAGEKIKGDASLNVTARERKQLMDEAKNLGDEGSLPRRGIGASRNRGGGTRSAARYSDGARSTAAKLRRQKGVFRAERFKGYGKRGLVAGGAIAAAAGGKALMDKKSSADDLFDMAYERADEFAKLGSIDDYDGSFIDDCALDILDEHGFELVD
jgi:hypothetical protein